MIAHLWKMIWNRKRANALMLTELLAAFLVLAGLGTAGAYYLHNLRQPLGYSIEDVWVLGVGHGISPHEPVPAELMVEAQTLAAQLLQTVDDLPEVEAVAGVMTGPYVSGYRGSQSSDGDDIPVLGRGLPYDVDSATDDFPRVMGLTLLKGRWFGKADDGASYHPAVINQRMAQDFFGEQDPLGQQIGTGAGELPVRVVGVIAGYRQKGELAPPLRYMFRRHLPTAAEVPYHKLFLKTRPGTGAAFEAVLEKRARATGKPDWSYSARRLTDVRDGVRRVELMPLMAAGIVAVFLMLMVILGLTGVLWQNVTRRTKEIGLRRAKGATRSHIYGQILGELMVMTFIAVVLGTVLIAHVPFLQLLEDMTASIYLQGGAAAALAIFLLTALCGFYPARLAARVQPASALRDD